MPPPPNTPDEGLATLVSHLVRDLSPSSTRSNTPEPDPELEPQEPQQHGDHPPPRPPRSPLPPPPLDYQEFEYVDDVDDTLLCPICRTPFHEPITTKSCGHTFCKACLRRAIELQPICPIDRQPIAFHPDQLCHPRIVSHQLDRLKVRCPNAGCSHVTTRGLIGAHYDRDCKRTPVSCPDTSCGKFVAREEAELAIGCLHQETKCSHCSALVIRADRELHYETSCEGQKTKCEQCNAVVVRHRLTNHIEKDCPETQTVCKFHSFGCPVAGTRRVVDLHESARCVYEAIGKLMRDRAEDRAVISDLRGRLTSLERARTADASSRSPRSRLLLGDIVDFDLSAPSSSGAEASASHSALPSSAAGTWDSPEDYMLAQFERIEAKMEDLRKMLTELDGRHSLMLLNETMPLKDQLAELRSNLGVINMHTTWLMNVQRQNRVAAGGGGGATQGQQQGQQRSAGNGGNGGGAGGVGGTTQGTGRTGEADGMERQRVHVPPRRMSGEHPPRL